MDFLKAQFLKIQEQLAGLSATQKMLVVSLLTIMVMTLLWWSHWAAQPEMSPLLDQTMSADDIGQIATNLDAQGIPHEVVGDKVYVPADRKLEIMAVLGYSQALPKNFDSGFDAIIKQMNWLDPPDKNQEMFQHAKNQTLSELIRRFPGVSDAEVVVDPTTQVGFDQSNVQPVATVTITTGRNSSASGRQLAESAADVVSGAQAGLDRSRIHVVVNGMPFEIKDGEDSGGGMSGDESVDMQKRWEDYYHEKIVDNLSYIRGVMVSVTVKLDTSHTTTTSHTVDPKQTVSVPTRSEESSEENTPQAASSEEPGAVPNAANQPIDLNSGGGGGGSSNTSEDKNEFKADYTQKDQQVVQGAGSATVESASVRVPRSYFIQAYKNENGGKDPDDPTVLSAYITKELQQIHDQVKGCAVFPTDDVLYVASYSDTPQPEMPMGEANTSSTVTTTIGRNGKEIAVGVLAVLSLFMVMMMVRKGGGSGGGGGAVTEPLEEGEVQTLKGNETVVGNASENAASLDGMELDEETVKAQQMMDQVQQMVQSNPDAAASLVKKWMNR